MSTVNENFLFWALEKVDGTRTRSDSHHYYSMYSLLLRYMSVEYTNCFFDTPYMIVFM